MQMRKIGHPRSAMPNCRVVSSWAWHLNPNKFYGGIRAWRFALRHFLRKLWDWTTCRSNQEVHQERVHELSHWGWHLKRASSYWANQEPGSERSRCQGVACSGIQRGCYPGPANVWDPSLSLRAFLVVGGKPKNILQRLNAGGIIKARKRAYNLSDVSNIGSCA